FFCVFQLLSCLFFACVIILLKCLWSAEHLDIQKTTEAPRESFHNDRFIFNEWFKDLRNNKANNNHFNDIYDPENIKSEARFSKFLDALRGKPSQDKQFIHRPVKSNAFINSEQPENEKSEIDYTTTELQPEFFGPRLSSTLLKILA
ncbi:hypothetical protein KR009_007044, partial [Drosophila setifemur]